MGAHIYDSVTNTTRDPAKGLLAVPSIRRLRAGPAAMKPETLDRILDAIPGEPDNVKFTAFNIDYSCLSPQLQLAVQGLEAEAVENGTDFYAANPTKDLVRRIHAATQAAQIRLNESATKVDQIYHELNEGRKSEEDAQAEIAALEKNGRGQQVIRLSEAVWQTRSDRISV